MINQVQQRVTRLNPTCHNNVYYKKSQCIDLVFRTFIIEQLQHTKSVKKNNL